MIAFEDESYGEMVLHPPPISYLSTIMIPFVFSSTLMKYVTMAFSYSMHWIENTFIIIGFFLFEIIIAPLAYLKVWFNIIMNSIGLVKTIINGLAWTILGLPFMSFLILRDSIYLLRILC